MKSTSYARASAFSRRELSSTFEVPLLGFSSPNLYPVYYGVLTWTVKNGVVLCCSNIKALIMACIELYARGQNSLSHHKVRVWVPMVFKTQTLKPMKLCPGSN